VLNNTVINAVGRVRGPAYFYRTTDAGTTWQVKDMSPYAAGLIDVFFFSPDTGIAVGLTNVDHDSSNGVVLYTTNGGITWEKKFQTSRVREWCWKISFPSRNVGYVSLQRNSQSQNHFLKTTDGGTTWSEKVFPVNYFIQGIGFANDTLGWIGGLGVGPIYETKNGGESWSSIGLGARINRFRFFNSGLGYAMGDSLYKYEPTATDVVASGEQIPTFFELSQNFPNPFNPSTSIQFDLPAPAYVSLRVYDLLGRELKRLVEERLDAGRHTATFHPGDIPSGVYYYSLQAGERREVKKMMYIR
ncbi:MAG: T9SS type A sorting domain-containing protein, partial [Bacteroidota bacterium]